MCVLHVTCLLIILYHDSWENSSNSGQAGEKETKEGAREARYLESGYARQQPLGRVFTARECGERRRESPAEPDNIADTLTRWRVSQYQMELSAVRHVTHKDMFF